MYSHLEMFSSQLLQSPLNQVGPLVPLEDRTSTIENRLTLSIQIPILTAGKMINTFSRKCKGSGFSIRILILNYLTSTDSFFKPLAIVEIPSHTIQQKNAMVESSLVVIDVPRALRMSSHIASLYHLYDITLRNFSPNKKFGSYITHFGRCAGIVISDNPHIQHGIQIYPTNENPGIPFFNGYTSDYTSL